MKDERFVVYLGPHFGPLLRGLAANEGFEQPQDYAARLLAIALNAVAEVKRRDAAGEFLAPLRESDAADIEDEFDDDIPF